ncbi:MAG: hypothetical protein ACI8Y8_002506 [Planctomycetota bacterium]|jgi:hypothetical protein
MHEGLTPLARSDGWGWPPWRTRTVMLCALMGMGEGSLLGAVTVASKFRGAADQLFDESFEELGMTAGILALGLSPLLLFGAIIGSVIGLLCSPILFKESDKPHLMARFVVATFLGCMVAFLAGSIVWIGSIPFVGFAVVVSFGQAGRLFRGGWGAPNIMRVLAGPALSVLALGGWAFLTRLPDDEAQLIALLGDNSSETREAAAAKLHEMAGIEPFLTALEHPDPRVRESAVLTVGSTEPDSHLQPLMEATKDPNRRVRVMALGTLFHRGTEQPLLDALGDANTEMTRMLLYRVGWCGDASHIPALEALLDRPDESVRDLVASTIEALRRKTSAH